MEKLTRVLRVVILALVVLALIPIVIHLWFGPWFSAARAISHLNIDTSQIARAIYDARR